MSDEEYSAIPEKHRPESKFIKRHKMIELDMPSFNSVTNRVGVIFDKESPAVVYNI